MIFFYRLIGHLSPLIWKCIWNWKNWNWMTRDWDRIFWWCCCRKFKCLQQPHGTHNKKKCQDYNGVGFLSSRFQNKIRVLLFLSFCLKSPLIIMIKQVAKRKRERERDEEQRKRNQRKIKGTGVILSAAANKITKKMGNQTGKILFFLKKIHSGSDFGSVYHVFFNVSYITVVVKCIVMARPTPHFSWHHQIHKEIKNVTKIKILLDQQKTKKKNEKYYNRRIFNGFHIGFGTFGFI